MPSPTILSQSIIDRLVPPGDHTVAELEALYPARNLTAGAEVTRIAPSPTGMMHIGVLYAALISERIAHLSNGVFILRIEDTDRKREVEGAQDFIIESLERFDIRSDEGVVLGGERGVYGPYTQSQRKNIYHAYIRQMLESGQAYPCFATPEQIQNIVSRQNTSKVRPGYYGDWAVWRNKPEDEVLAALEAGQPYVIRFRSTGDIERRRTLEDAARGSLELPESDNDVVIMKQDGLPTYHFAHVVDDHMMRTTLCVRGDEWLPSTTLHIQLTEALGLAPFRYAHIAPIQKTENGSRRKLSKRKDPEASVSYYTERGYLPQTIIEYLLNQANSSYEDWRSANLSADYTDFPFSVDNLSRSGGLFSFDKLDSIGAEHIAQLDARQLYDLIAPWAAEFEPDFYVALTKDPEYSIAALAIERDGQQPRKDMSHLSQAPYQYGYFYDNIYTNIQVDENAQSRLDRIDPDDRRAISSSFLASYDPADDNDTWFSKIKQLGESLGYTPDMKAYRKQPEQFKGSVADVAMVLRVALTKRNQTPNLRDVMAVMGRDRVSERLRNFLS